MKSSLKTLFAVVLAVLAGTVVSVRGYLGSLEPPPAHVAAPSTSPWAELPPATRLEAAAAGMPVDGTLERVKDENCPTCAVTGDGVQIADPAS